MSKKKYPLVFIVEDNKAYSRLLEHHLGLNNYTNIVPIISGEECLKKLYLKPDIIIQDYKLQGISGLNVLQRTKKILPNTEFIFLSGIDDIDIAIDSVKSGAYYYFVKDNVAFNRLLPKLQEIMDFQLSAIQNKKKGKQVLLYLIVTIILIIILIMILY